jgi:hypothetical protein
MGNFLTTLDEIFTQNKTKFDLELNGKSNGGGTILLKEKKQLFRPTFMDYLNDGE